MGLASELREQLRERTIGQSPPPVLGLRANWRQFWLLVLVNVFVGAMVGLERAVLPLIAEREFGIASTSAALSFITVFGVAKAVTNLVAGRLGDARGRRQVLIAGWLVGLPVPLLLMWAPAWSWVVLANGLLGVNQGLTWSMTVIMKIDLVGPRRRGFAMGLNEFAGYLAVAVAAFATGYLAGRYGLRPAPFYLGVAVAVAGLLLSVFAVRETAGHAVLEARGRAATGRELTARASGGPSVAAQAGLAQASPAQAGPSARELFARVSWRDPALSSASQAGLVNNLNDGLAWGLFPLFFAARGLSVHEIGILAAVYPAAWGVCQLWTGALSDRWGRKWLIVGGMVLQGAALAAIALTSGFAAWLAEGLVLGVGTAMVYPTLLAAVGDVAHPSWRGSAVGVYRLWRDLGYAVGAVLAGVLADAFGMRPAIGAVGLLTVTSGLVVAARMPETHASVRTEGEGAAASAEGTTETGPC